MESPFTIFGLAPDCSLDDLRMSYRALVLRNHPDRFHHLGPEVVHRQTEVTATLNSAYEEASAALGSESDLLSTLFGASEFTFTLVKPTPYRIHEPVHRDHINESYRHLLGDLSAIEFPMSNVGQNAFAINNVGLAVHLYERALSRLLNDFPKYRDLEGIIHKYLGNLAHLLMRVGLYSAAFKAFLKTLELNVRAYYSGRSAFDMVAEAIHMARTTPVAVDIWHSALLTQFQIIHDSLNWNMARSLTASKMYGKLLSSFESGHLVGVIGCEGGLLIPDSMPENERAAIFTGQIVRRGPKYLRWRQRFQKYLFNAMIKDSLHNGQCASLETLQRLYPRACQYLSVDADRLYEFYDYARHLKQSAFEELIIFREQMTEYLRLSDTPPYQICDVSLDYDPIEAEMIWSRHFPATALNDSAVYHKLPRRTCS